MSVKVHEAICMDSAQKRFWWMDHFLGDQVQDEWNSTGNVGSAAVVDAQTGGIVRITTGATANDNWRIDWGVIRSLLVAKKIVIEWRAKLSQIGAMILQIGCRFDGANKFYFWYDTNMGVNWYIHTDAVGGSSVDTGIVVDTDWHIYRIEAHTHGSNHLHFYYDGAEVTGSPLTVAANITANHVMPWCYLHTREDVLKIVDIDYVAARQDR